MLEGTVRPDLYIAAKTDASSIDELKEVVVKARWVTWNRYGFVFADKVPKDEYCVYLFSPFLKRIPTDYPKHPDYLFRGVDFRPVFFTEILDGWEYQDADFEIMLVEDAVNKWNRQEVAAALRFYEQWLLTEDAQKSAPDNHECYFLRERLQLNRIASELFLPNTDQLPDVVEDVPNATHPKQTLSDRYKKCAEKQLALDCAVQMILEAILANLPFPKLTDVADKVFAEGFDIDPETYNKRLSEEKVIKALKSQAEKRPQSTNGNEPVVGIISPTVTTTPKQIRDFAIVGCSMRKSKNTHGR